MSTSAIWGYAVASKPGGRPPKESGDQGTKQVRLFTDLGEKVADLADLFKISTAQICDPLLRADIEAQWDENRTQIERMKELKNEQEKIREKAQSKKKR